MLFRVPHIVSNKQEDDKSTKKKLNPIPNNSPQSQHLKTEKLVSLPSRDIIDDDVKSIALPFSRRRCATPELESKMRFACLPRRSKDDEVDVAQRQFSVIKINNRGNQQPRTLILSARGILNIRPTGKESSREK